MDTFLMQDWITVAGATSGSVIQAAPTWLDLAPYQDVVIWLEVAEVAQTLEFQTAPARDNRLFLPIARSQATGTTRLVLQVGDSPTLSNAPAQIARWLRWVASGGASNWTMTFRVTVMANRQGRG